MKIVLNVKDKRAFNPIKNDVIIFDGKEWYITTKEEILKESLDLLNEIRDELNKIIKENSDFKKDVADQILTISEVVRQMYSK